MKNRKLFSRTPYTLVECELFCLKTMRIDFTCLNEAAAAIVHSLFYAFWDVWLNILPYFQHWSFQFIQQGLIYVLKIAFA